MNIYCRIIYIFFLRWTACGELTEAEGDVGGAGGELFILVKPSGNWSVVEFRHRARIWVLI